MGAINDFDLVRFQGPTVPVEFSVVVGVTATEILPDDPDRLMVIMSNNDAGAVYWSTSPKLAALTGFAIGSGIVTTFQVQNDGQLCGRRIWGIAPTGPFTVNVLVLRRQHLG